MRARVLATAGAALLLLPVALPAQEVQFTPRPDRPAERRLASFIEGSDYDLWVRDSVLAPDDTVSRGLLILESVVRIAGRVEGDVFVVDGDLFLRPGAEITGDVVALGGGFYGSGLARVEGELTYRPNLFFQAIPRNGGWVIISTRETLEIFEPDGLHGLRFPEVNRVDGWTPSVGARLQLVDVPGQPSLRAVASYRTERGEPGGRLEHYWHPTARTSIGLEVARITASHDRWLRDEPGNTLSFLLAGRDHRNHYEADRWGMRVEHRLDEDEVLALGIGAEEARSLSPRLGRVLFGSDRLRPNPEIDEGTSWSVSLEGHLTEPAGPGNLQADLRFEGADSTAAGDFSYLLADAQLRWSVGLPNGHRLTARLVGRGDLAGALPRQRWSAVGGPGTLPTFPLLSVRGPRLTLAGVRYHVPLPFRVPALGVPEIYAGGATAAAWAPGDRAVYRENLVAGLRFLGLDLTAALEPSTGDTEVVLGVRVPADGGRR